MILRALASLCLLLIAGAAIATLPSSGAISLSDVQTEFGGSASTSINEYYRGGAYVPSYFLNESIPTSGQISLNQFHGASSSNPSAQLFNGFATSNEAVLPSTTASVIFYTNGQCEYYAPGTAGGTSKSSNYTWVLAAAAEDTDMYVSVTGDEAYLTSGTLNAWVRVLNTRSFIMGSEPGQTKSVTLTVTVRNAYTLSVIAGPVTVVLTTGT
jgi:hypothetical protein